VEEHTVNVEEKPSDDDCRFLGQSLTQFNFAQGFELRQMAIFLRDRQKNIIGGALGWTCQDLLHINLLWIREDVRRRGYGKRVLLTAEAEAVKEKLSTWPA
jgi:hypothetical protein